MAGDNTERNEMIVQRPAPGTLVRHSGAVEVGPAARGPATVEVRDGAAWLRATADGPGLVLTHGASTVQLQEGAAVVEVHDFEALVVVIAGRVAVKGTTALARSVSAGHAVSISLDGAFGDAEAVAPGELATDRMIVENLARDLLGPGGSGDLGVEGGDRDIAPSLRGAVDGPPPAAPGSESSALESALAGVGVAGSPPDGTSPPEPDAGPVPEAQPARGGVEEAPASRRRLFLVLVVAALIVVAVVAAVALSAGASDVSTL